MKRRLWPAIVTALLCAAPVPGDIGSCGEQVEALDASRFFRGKQSVDCQRCTECSLDTVTCRLACSGRPPEVTAFPDRCQPVIHDGEVCLRALLTANCDDYGAYVDDHSPTVPSECDFCPP